jgi:ELWxxDGT repeat protein
MTKKVLFSLALVLSFGSLPAQLTMISNIYTGSTSSTPDFLYPFNGKVLFTADHETFGVEQWALNPSGSVQLNYEVNTAGSSSSSGHFCEFNGKVYFQGYEDVYGSELYEYDGITAPIRVSDINPLSTNSLPSGMVVFNGKIYFSAIGPGNDYELYEYDGVNPPALVANINPTGNSFPLELTVFNSKLYFRANDGVNGIEIWEFDGTNPPAMLLDINPGANHSTPQGFAVFNNNLYFGADNGVNGSELWMYDGTNPPAMVVDMIAGSGSFNPLYLYVFDGKLVFSAIDAVAGAELWQYDGVSNPTMVFDINTNPSVGLHNAHPRHFIEYNGRLFFRATDETHGRELWSWDGVNDPEFMVDINPGTAHSSEDWNLNATKRMVVQEQKLILGANNGVVGEELFAFCWVNTTVTENNLVLTVSQTGAVYQWMDCNAFAPIAGETGQTFTPSVDGDYAVVVTNGDCIDTSDCYSIVGLGIGESARADFNVYPNPTNSNVTISGTETIEQIVIYNAAGQVVQTETHATFSVENLPAGVYILRVQTEEGISGVRLVKE